MSEVLLSCPLCEGTQLKELYVTSDRHYGIKGSYRLVRCATCSLIFLNPLYSSEELAPLYPKADEYFAYQDHSQVVGWKHLCKRLLGYNVGTKDPRFRNPGTVLDLGCGTGWFLELMREKGWNVRGVEINEQAAAYARSKGLETSSGVLQEARFPAEYFDYVRSNHSLEHISCPNETLSEIYRILKPTGKVFIGVPNIDSLNARVYKKYWWHLCVPVHPFSYSVKTLSRLLAKHNFKVERVRFNSDYFGILGSFQIWMNRKNGTRSMEGAFVNNYVLRFFCQWIANLADIFGWGDAIEVTAVKAHS